MTEPKSLLINDGNCLHIILSPNTERCVHAKSLQSCLILCDPMNCSPPGSSVHEILQARMLEWAAMPPPEDLPNSGIKPRSPTLQTDSLPAEPLGKPENTGMGGLSLLQQIFPTRELYQSLLHCRLILYQLSHQGSPVFL